MGEPLPALTPHPRDHGTMPRPPAAFATAVRARLRVLRDAVPGWLGGVLAGAQGAFIALLVVWVPALAIAATSSPTAGVTTDWGGATSLAANLLLLAHGAPLVTEAATISLLPLGLTGVCALLIAALARRFTAPTLASAGLTVATYAAGIGLIAALAGRAGGDTARAAVVAALVVVVAVTVGMRLTLPAVMTTWRQLPPRVRMAARRAAATMLVWVTIAAAVTTVWAVLGWRSIADIATALGPDGVSAPILALGQLAYVPVMVVWMVAWLTGQGFAVGDGTLYAPDLLATDALPVLPLVGALPSAAGGVLTWAPLLPILGAALVRLVTGRRREPSWEQARTDLLALGMIVGSSVLVLGAASGSAGPGRLEYVGPDVLITAALVTALSAVGFALATGVLGVAHLLRRRVPGDPGTTGEPETSPVPASSVGRSPSDRDAMAT